MPEDQRLNVQEGDGHRSSCLLKMRGGHPPIDPEELLTHFQEYVLQLRSGWRMSKERRWSADSVFLVRDDDPEPERTAMFLDIIARVLNVEQLYFQKEYAPQPFHGKCNVLRIRICDYDKLMDYCGFLAEQENWLPHTTAAAETPLHRELLPGSGTQSSMRLGSIQ